MPTYRYTVLVDVTCAPSEAVDNMRRLIAAIDASPGYRVAGWTDGDHLPGPADVGDCPERMPVAPFNAPAKERP